ncbi:hypothetical protein HanIR_Chr01g0037051 [Helianthus annuus]|nr:hypothetical protein HanIR_Chr01g0037051 [Helianthus annuus]
MKLEKLLCLKYVGNNNRANSGGFHTTKLFPFVLHDTISSVTESSTISYVLIRNGAGPPPPEVAGVTSISQRCTVAPVEDSGNPKLNEVC